MGNKKGKFIVIEGGDGAGKGTQIEMLKRVLDPRKFYFTREPGGSLFAEEIRDLTLSPKAKDENGKTMFLAMWTSRASHMFHVIALRLLLGVNVICDRFDSSTYAYNIFGQKEKGLIKLFWCIRKVILGDFVPDLYIYLDLDPEIGKQRQTDGGQETNHFDEQNMEFKNQVREGMFEFFETKGIHYTIIDASLSVDEVHEEIMKHIIEATD